MFQSYVVAKCQYEMEMWALIEHVRQAEEGAGMKAMGFSHPYSYATFQELQEHARAVQRKWEALGEIQRKVMETFCVRIANIEPPQG